MTDPQTAARPLMKYTCEHANRMAKSLMAKKPTKRRISEEISQTENSIAWSKNNPGKGMSEKGITVASDYVAILRALIATPDTEGR